MRKTLPIVGGAIATGIAYLLTTIVFALIFPNTPEFTAALSPEDRILAAKILPLLSLVIGALIAWIVGSLRYRGAALFFAAFAALWLTISVLNTAELLYFRKAFPALGDRDVLSMCLSDAASLAAAVGTAMLVSRKRRASLFLARRASPARDWPNRPALRALAAILAYPPLYFAFGFIAMAFPAAREFYAGWAAARGHVVPLLLFQVPRAALWLAAALLIVRGAADRRTALLLVPALFVASTALTLILPNPLMPAPVRLAHGIELTLSMTLIGFLEARLFLPKDGPAREATRAA